jgi:threonine/homoserine/homoserine lactone efflux protein
MSWPDLFAFLLILATAAAIPGPDIAAIIGTSLSGGFSRALSVIGGIIVGHIIWIIAAATGLAAIAQALGTAFIAVKLCAIAYLLYLAWGLWTAPVSAEADGEKPAFRSTRPGVVTGVMISLSNPKALVFFSAVMPTILPVAKLSAADLALLIASSSVVFVAVFGSWAALAAKARSILGSSARRRGLNRISAVLIAGTGIAVATR